MLASYRKTGQIRTVFLYNVDFIGFCDSVQNVTGRQKSQRLLQQTLGHFVSLLVSNNRTRLLGMVF